MSTRSPPRLYRCAAALTMVAMVSILTACSGLRPVATPFPTFYSLDSAQGAMPVTDLRNAIPATIAQGAPGTIARGAPTIARSAPATIAQSSPATIAQSAPAMIAQSAMTTTAGGSSPEKALTLIIDPPHAASGFDSQRIIYVREAHRIEYFAHSEWVDTPARMLAPLLVGTLEGSGAFRAVVLTPSSASGELRLVTEIIRLQQEFGAIPSRVRFTLRAYLVDEKTHHVLARCEFDATVPAASEDPYGGVVAASRVVNAVLGELSAFCVEAMHAATFAK